MHLMGNPIDAIWSILSRQEAVRQRHLFCLAHTPDISRELTVVLASYDRWLSNPCPYILHSVVERRAKCSNRSEIISEEEKVLIRQAALSLRGSHVDGSSKAKIAALAYMLSLLVVLWKAFQWEDTKLRSEASHIFALVAGSSHLVVAVRLNGKVGTVLHHEETMRTVYKLCIDLERSARTSEVPSLLPRPDFAADPLPLARHSSTAFFRSLQKLGCTSGAMNSIRPGKLFCTPLSDSAVKLAVLSGLVVLFSTFGGIAITLLTTPGRDVDAILALSCSFTIWLLTWAGLTVIAALMHKGRVSQTVYTRTLVTLDAIASTGIAACYSWSLISTSKQQGPLGPQQTQAMLWLTPFLIQMGLILLLEMLATPSGAGIRELCLRSLDEALADGDAVSE